MLLYYYHHAPWQVALVDSSGNSGNSTVRTSRVMDLSWHFPFSDPYELVYERDVLSTLEYGT